MNRSDHTKAVAVLVYRRLRVHFINVTMFRAGDRHRWELCFQGAWTCRHLESFSSCFFCFCSSCSRLRSAIFCSSCCPASSRQSCCRRGCWLIWQPWWSWGNKSNYSLPAEEVEKRTKRWLVLQSLLFMVPLELLLLCAQPPGESQEEEYGLAVVAVRSCWMHGRRMEYIWHRLRWSSLYTEKTSLILVASDQFYSHWASDMPNQCVT